MVEHIAVFCNRSTCVYKSYFVNKNTIKYSFNTVLSYVHLKKEKMQS